MLRRILGWAVAAGAIVGGIVLGYEPVGVLVFLFLILRPIEKLWPRHRTPLRRLGLRTDITHLLLTPLTQIAGLVVGVVIGILSLAWLPGSRCDRSSPPFRSGRRPASASCSSTSRSTGSTG